MAKYDPLANLSTLANAASAIATINSNNDKVEAALDNTISRDGSGPNMMEADLDINSHRLLNVGDPVDDTDGVNFGNLKTLVNAYAGDIVANATFSQWTVAQFTAIASQTLFPLNPAPVSLASMDVTVNGVTKLATTDYVLSSTGLTFVTPMAGGEKVQVRYGQVMPVGSSDAATAAYAPSGVGAVARTVQDKLREFVTPEDFGAIGDGVDHPVSEWLVGGLRSRGYANLAAIQVDFPHVTATTQSIDWAAFQQAINVCKVNGKVLRASGNYVMNRGLVIDQPMHLEGGGAFRQGAFSTPSYVAGAKITATAAVAAMIYVSPAANPDALHNVIVRGFLLDGNNIALKGFVADSCTRSTFENITVMRCVTVGLDFTDAKGYYFYKNYLNALNYNSTASAEAQASDGVWFRDTVAAAGGCVQNLVGWITASTADGNGITIGGSDNNEYGSLMGFVTGTGTSLLFKGPSGFGFLAPRNNFIRYSGGKIVDQTDTRSNYIHLMSSESGSITLTGAGGEVKFRMFNYTTGQWWSTPEYTMKDVRIHQAGAFGLQGATSGTLNSIWACVDFADGATQGIALSELTPYTWHNGSIKAITLSLAPSTSVAGNFRIRVRTMTPASGGSTATPATDDLFTITPSASAGFMTKHTLTLPTPASVTKGDAVLIRIDRVGADGADTHTGVMKLLSVGTHYVATGPSSDGGGGGPYQVLDPTI